MINYALILARRYQSDQWTLDGDAYAGLTWLSDSSKPSKATLDGLWSAVQAEIAADEAKLLLGA